MPDTEEQPEPKRRRRPRRRSRRGAAQPAANIPEDIKVKSGEMTWASSTFRVTDRIQDVRADKLGSPPRMALKAGESLVCVQKDRGSDIVRLMVVPSTANVIESRELRESVGVIDGFRFRAFAYDEFEKIRHWRKFSPTNTVFIATRNKSDEGIMLEKTSEGFLAENRDVSKARFIEFYLHGATRRFHVFLYMSEEKTLSEALEKTLAFIGVAGYGSDFSRGKQKNVSKVFEEELSYVAAKRVPFGLATKRTLERAQEEWPKVSGGGNPTELKALSFLRTESLRTLANVYNISYDQTSVGTRALFVMEDEVNDRQQREITTPGYVTSPDDAMVFASAIATALDAYATAGKHPESDVYGCVMRSVRNWVRREGTVFNKPSPTQMHVRNLSEVEFNDLSVLIQYAPWLVWWIQGRHPEKGALRFESNAATLADAFLLARPARGYRSTGDTSFTGVAVNPRQMQSICRLKDATIDARLWDRVSHAATQAWSDPSVLDNPELGEFSKLLQDSIRHRELDPATKDVLVRWDISADNKQVVLVNRTDTDLEILIGDDTIVLGPRTLDDPTGTGWVSAPIQLTDSVFSFRVNGRAPVSLRVPDAIPILPFTETLIREQTPLFMGREMEIERIFDQAQPGSTMRIPILIWGNRRAGKTTMAWQAMDRAENQGLLHAKVFFDVYKVVGEKKDKHVQRELTKKINAELKDLPDIELPELSDDFLAYLDELDEALAGRTIGIILDEFDTLFWRDPESPIFKLVRRMSGISFRNIVLIGTTQRFSAKEAVLKDWIMIQCPSSLTWKDAIGFFSGNLTEPEGELILNRLTVLPDQLTADVVGRIGYRPYLWSKTYSRLSRNLKVSRDQGNGTVFPTSQTIEDNIRKAVDSEPIFLLPFMSTKNIPVKDILREDRFSLDEKRLLAAIVDSPDMVIHRRDVPDHGGYTALSELIEREVVEACTENTDMYRISLPVLAEHLQDNIIKLYSVIEQDSRV